MPALPSGLTEPLWDQFATLLPVRPVYDPAHPLGCHRRRVSDRIVFDKLLQVLRFGCSYQAIADSTCSATTIRGRRDEWIRLGAFAQLREIVLNAYDRIVGLVLEQIAIDGSITKAPGGGEAAGRSPVDRGKRGMKRSAMTDGYGIPLGRVLAGANCHDSPLLAPTLDLLNDLGPLPDDITVHLDAGYDSAKTRAVLDERGLRGQIAHKDEKAPLQATQRWHVEATHAWQNAFHRLARCYERVSTSSTPSLTSQTPSSPYVASSAAPGPLTAGTTAQPNAPETALSVRPLSSPIAAGCTNAPTESSPHARSHAAGGCLKDRNRQVPGGS